MARFEVQYDSHAAAIALEHQEQFNDAAMAAAEKTAHDTMVRALNEAAGIHAAYDPQHLARAYAAVKQQVVAAPTQAVAVVAPTPIPLPAPAPVPTFILPAPRLNSRRGEGFERDGELIIVH